MISILSDYDNKPIVDKYNLQAYIRFVKRKIDKIISIFGSQAALAKAVGVSNNAVCKWVAKGYIPPSRVVAVYQLIQARQPQGDENITLESLLSDSISHLTADGKRKHVNKRPLNDDES